MSEIRINLINIYAPVNPSERKTFFDNLHDYFIPSDATIIGGDFNCYDNELDKVSGNVSVANYLLEFKSTFKFIDILRRLHRKSRQMTWFNADHSIGSRLDKFLVSPNLVDFVRKCDILPCVLSDHDFVDLAFDFKDLIPCGPGIWKFNNSLLDDEDFCQFISDRIMDLSSCKSSFDSVQQWWDFFKSSLKHDITSFAREKRKRLSRERVS